VFENLELSLPRGRNVAGALFWKRTEEVREQVKDVPRMIFLQRPSRSAAETLSHWPKAVARDRHAADSRIPSC
jgi:urea transport system ATP-binding protein